MDRLTITVDEAARQLGMGRATVYDAVKTGEMPSIKLGRRIVIPRAAFEELLRGSKPAA